MVKNIKTICIWSARVVMFLCSRGENVVSKLFLFPSIYRHKLVPSTFICSNPGATILPRPHLGTQTCFAEFRVLFFSTIQTKYNSQSTTHCYLALRGALECDLSWLVLPWGPGGGGGGGALPINGLMRMCRWMGSHFHDRTDYNGDAFSSIFYRVTRMGSHFCGILRFW